MYLIMPTYEQPTTTPQSIAERACVVFETTAGELSGWLRLLTTVHELSDELGRDVVIPLEDWAIPAALCVPLAVAAGRFLPAQLEPRPARYSCPSCELQVSKEALQLGFRPVEDLDTRFAVRLSREAIQRLFIQAAEMEEA